MRKSIVNIAGTRPQFVKASIMMKFIDEKLKLKNYLLHTGQHFDFEMSKIFFNELKFKKKNLIKLNLKLKKKKRIDVLSNMIISIYKKLSSINPALVIIYGDTDTTLAAVIAARRLKLKIMHIEAGLRSNQINMLEEQNRVIADHLSDYLIAPTINAKKNLIKENINKNNFFFGDVMFDCFKFNLSKITDSDENLFINNFKLKKSFIFLTLHRDINSNKVILTKFLKNIKKIKKIFYWPIHPKINIILKKNKITLPNNIISSKPISYYQTLISIKNCEFVVTDSGGVQKEAYFLKKKIFILRKETEWIELVKIGSAKLIGMNIKKIKSSQSFLKKKVSSKKIFGSGDSVKKILNLINTIV
jgi:UDP-GlcNAc3NAcA epimerase